MHTYTIPDMCSILFEMMKEVNRQTRIQEDEFYHVSELQFFVTMLHEIYQASNIFVSYYIDQPFFESVTCVFSN